MFYVISMVTTEKVSMEDTQKNKRERKESKHVLQKVKIPKKASKKVKDKITTGHKENSQQNNNSKFFLIS